MAGRTVPVQAADEKPTFTPVKVTPELEPMIPGTAMALRVLVPYPPEIAGVQSWTIDSRLHRGAIASLAISPDHKLAATGGTDGVVRIWEVSTGRLLRALVGHSTYVRCLSWSPCGSTLASCGSWEMTARLWDPHLGKPLRVFKGFKSYVFQAVWSPDGARLALGCYGNGLISMWHPATNEMKHFAELGQAVHRMRWAPDGKYLAVTAATLPVMMLDSETGKTKFSLGENADAFHAIAWSPDSKRLIAGGGTRCAIWDVTAVDPNDEKAMVKLRGGGVAVALSPDGKQALTVRRTGVVQQWDAATGKAAGTHAFEATELVWMPAGPLFVTHEGRVSGYKLGEKTPRVDFEVGSSATPLWTLYRPIVTGVGTAKLAVWDATTGKFLQSLDGHTAPVTTVSWNRDGKLLASAAQDRKVNIWDVKSGKTTATLEGHTATVSDVAWSPDGRTLATAGYDKTVRLWDPNGKPIRTFDAHTGAVRVLGWVPGSNQLASAGDDAKILFWNPQADEPVRTIRVREPVHSLSFATVNRTLVLACGMLTEFLPVYNAVTGQTVAELWQNRHHGHTGSLAWSPGTGQLFSGRSTYIAQIWDVATAKPVRTIYTTGAVQYAEWPGTGATQVLGCNDRTIHFIDASSGRYRGVILNEKDGLAMITADGHWRYDSNKPCELIAVAQTADGQTTLPLEEFAKKFRYRNNSTRVKFTVR